MIAGMILFPVPSFANAATYVKATISSEAETTRSIHLQKRKRGGYVLGGICALPIIAGITYSSDAMPTNTVAVSKLSVI